MPLGPSIWIFLHPLGFFSANGTKACPGQNPACEILFKLCLPRATWFLQAFRDWNKLNPSTVTRALRYMIKSSSCWKVHRRIDSRHLLHSYQWITKISVYYFSTFSDWKHQQWWYGIFTTDYSFKMFAGTTFFAILLIIWGIYLWEKTKIFFAILDNN